jgi:hypothetical protein
MLAIQKRQALLQILQATAALLALVWGSFNGFAAARGLLEWGCPPFHPHKNRGV